MLKKRNNCSFVDKSRRVQFNEKEKLFMEFELSQFQQ